MSIPEDKIKIIKLSGSQTKFRFSVNKLVVLYNHTVVVSSKMMEDYSK